MGRGAERGSGQLHTASWLGLRDRACSSSCWGLVQTDDMRATLQKLKFLQLDSGKEQDNTVLVSSFC